MIITLPWLKEHLKTKANENEIIDKLTNIGLEVEGIKESSGKLSDFKIAKIIKAEKHPNADSLNRNSLHHGSPRPLGQHGNARQHLFSSRVTREPCHS